MSSAPSTLIANLQIADGYLDEAFAFADELEEYEQNLLILAQRNIQIVLANRSL